MTGDKMSIPKEFICPVCHRVFRAPFTEEQIAEHLKTHSDDKSTLSRAKFKKTTGKR